MKKERECNTCHEVKPFTAFGKPLRDRIVRSTCMNCRVIRQRAQRDEKRLLRNPLKYFQCNNDNCCFIWKRNLGAFCSNCGGKCNE